MNANVDVKGTQGTERYREVEEKLRVWNSPAWMLENSRGIVCFDVSGRARLVFGASARNDCRGFSLEPFC